MQLLENPRLPESPLIAIALHQIFDNGANHLFSYGQAYWNATRLKFF